MSKLATKSDIEVFVGHEEIKTMRTHRESLESLVSQRRTNPKDAERFKSEINKVSNFLLKKVY